MNSHLQYFFEQIGWGASEQSILDELQTYCSTLPPTGLRYVYNVSSIHSEKDFAHATETYWQELLNRVHYASVISQLRANAWINGMLSGIRDQNFHAFAACLRGLIESIADSCDSLVWVPKHLEKKRGIITNALSGMASIQSYEDYLDERLETALIHFSHARGIPKGHAVPDTAKHKAKSTSDYLNILKGGAGKPLIPLYGDLCQITHPSSDSNLPFTLIHQDTSSISIYEVRNDLSFASLVGFSMRYKDKFPVIMKLSLDPPRQCLRALDTFTANKMSTVNTTI